MNNLPGTTIEAGISAESVKQMLDNLFMADGLMLSQVSRLTGLEPHAIQNWVKRGFLPPPVNKMYSKDQLCRVIIINMLRESLRIESITELLSIINGNLADTRDDSITDTDLYILFMITLENAARRGTSEFSDDLLPQGSVAPYVKYGDKGVAVKRIRKVLKLMYYAYRSVEYKKKAEIVMASID